MGRAFFDFTGKSVLVLGGSKGIGHEVCRQFTNSGALVTSIARSECLIESVSNITCDISDNRMLTEALATINDIDILVNVAGTNLCESIFYIDDIEWDRVLDTNLKSFYTSIKHAASLMKPKKKGKIVNVSSIAGRSKSIVSGVHYTASKYGIIGLTKQVAQELGPFGINVNCTCPSQTMTDMLVSSMSKQQIVELESKIPVRKISTAIEQALPILFLCTDSASYIHGAAIDINGGQL